jgi:CRISPR system Cascade subunit CasB
MTSIEKGRTTMDRSIESQVGAITGFIKACKDSKGAAKADYVALNRLDADAVTLTVQQISALTRALQRAGIDSAHLSVERWRRWAVIAHGIALTIHCAADEKTPYLGQQLESAGVSEARVTRLLNARGDAFFQALPRVLRLMSSRGVKPNWTEFGQLILNEGARHPAGIRIAEATRLRIVDKFVKAGSKSERKQ